MVKHSSVIGVDAGSNPVVLVTFSLLKCYYKRFTTNSWLNSIYCKSLINFISLKEQGRHKLGKNIVLLLLQFNVSLLYIILWSAN